MLKERLLGMSGRVGGLGRDGSWAQPSLSVGRMGLVPVKAVQKRCQGEIGKELEATPAQKSGDGKKVRVNEASSVLIDEKQQRREVGSC